MPRPRLRPTGRVNPHRDPQIAGFERLAQLEDEVRHLRDSLGREQLPARRRWGRVLTAALVATLTLGAAATAAAFVWFGRPGSQTVLRTNQGISFTVLFRGDVRDVEFFDAEGKSIPALWPAMHTTETEADQRERKPLAATRAASVLVTPSQLAKEGPTRIDVSYRFWGLRRSASLTFDAYEDGNRSLKNILEGTPQWVAFREYDGRLLVYFTGMLAFKPAIDEIRWGVDGEGLERTVQFARSSELGIESTDELYTAVPHGTRQVRVQIRWKDGSSSPVRTVLREDATLR